MAFPTTSLLDNFNRADSTTSLGSNWTSPLESTFSSPGILSNQAYCGGGTFKDAYWNVNQWTDVEAWVTLVALPTGVIQSRLYARVQNPGNASTLQGYWIQVNGAGASWIGKTIANTLITLNSSGAPTFAAGDSVGITVVGTLITMYRKPAAGAWAASITATDTDISGPGYIGIQTRNDSLTKWDDFGGGGIAANLGSTSWLGAL